MTHRFGFGANWLRYATHLTPERIAQAVESLKANLPPLQGKRFLDAGSGSGLFSLAAHQLGARVHSFDYDPDSVESTRRLSQGHWPVEQGSVLDPDYLKALGRFDVVYSWGVLHHTGDMWRALELVAPMATDRLFIAIYNDQGLRSRYWQVAKRLYNQGPVQRTAMIVVHLPILAARILVRTVTRRLKESRGMSLWYDYIDWLGGFPFEVATREEIRRFFEERGYELEREISVGNRSGCNQFVFRRVH